MNKKIYFPLLALAIAFVSCNDDLEAPTISSLDSEVVYGSYDLANNAVIGCYLSFGETNSYRGRFLPYYGFNTDIEWYNGMSGDQASDGSKYDIAKYNVSTTNDQLNNDNDTYAKNFEGIERCNRAIEGLREYADLDDPAMAQLLGEVLTIRAVYYSDLIKGWGDVPMRFEPVTTETMYAARVDHDLIYQQLLEDLKEAGDLCYWPNEATITSTVERVSAAFAKGLRARIALYAAGYSLRSNKQIELSSVFTDRSELYKIVRDECVEIINKGTNKLGEFYDTFHDQSTDVVSSGRESLWEIPYSDGRGRVLYTYGIRHESADQYTQLAKGGINGPTPFLYYDYDKDDVRRDITIVPYEYAKADATGFAAQDVESINHWNFGKLRFEWLAGAPSNRIVTSTNDDGINWLYMRLADVYLMAAEAINELEGPSAAAEYLRPVLERALPADKVETYMGQYTASKEAFFNGIVEQRKFEFAGEMLRKADLIRWNLLKTKLDEAIDKMTDMVNYTIDDNYDGAYADLPSKIYYTYEDDGETLKFYGLNHGETDADAPSGWESKSWIQGMTEQKTDTLEDGTVLKWRESKGYEKNIYFDYVDPDKQQYWPIMKNFIDSSNGMLNNDWLDK